MIEKVIRPIIILSGPVAAGKSTVAKELIKLAAVPTVYIEGDKFWFFIVKEEKSIGRSRNFKTIMMSMVAASVPYALNGYEVILDFSIPPWFLDTVRKITSARNVPIEYIVLKPSEKICEQRASSRAEDAVADYSLYHDLYFSFNEAQKYMICDDTNEAALIADKINKSRSEGMFRVPEEE